MGYVLQLANGLLALKYSTKITVPLWDSFSLLVTVLFVGKGVGIMSKRRANGEGNIRKRKDGRWEGRYTVGHDPETGKAIIKNVLGKT